MMGSGRLSILKEFFKYLNESKKWWLAPIIIILIMFSLLIVLTEGSAVLPFVYTLF